MKHISNLIDLEKVKSEKAADKSPEKNTASVINWLFRELRSNFTAFKQAWPDQETYTQAKKTWIKAFMLAGINKIEQIQHGLNKCYLMENPFVPTPGQFIAWCTPTYEQMGLKSPEEAFKEASSLARPDSSKNWSHTVVRIAAVETGMYKLATFPENKIYPLFERNYEIIFRKFINGEELKAPEKAIPYIHQEKEDDDIVKPEFKNLSREECFAAMKNMLSDR